jgi:quercetin dioxygenase-like cupin family protein
MTSATRPYIDRLHEADWDDVGMVAQAADPLLGAVRAGPILLLDLLNALTRDADLRSRCERHDRFDQLVLHDDPRASIRLHLFRPGYDERPHTHQATFASLTLAGTYTHQIFNPADHIRLVLERVEAAGTSFVLHHQAVHAVKADTDTASLVLRGPVASDRFQVFDREHHTSYWIDETADQTPERRHARAMTAAQLADAVGRVRQLVTQPTAHD